MRPFPSPYFNGRKNRIGEETITFGHVVGHVPRDISKYCTSALLCGGTIKCEITGKRQNKRGNGLEAPCKYIVKGPFHII